MLFNNFDATLETGTLLNAERHGRPHSHHGILFAYFYPCAYRVACAACAAYCWLSALPALPAGLPSFV
jgi:hypothetical protein